MNDLNQQQINNLIYANKKLSDNLTILTEMIIAFNASLAINKIRMDLLEQEINELTKKNL